MGGTEGSGEATCKGQQFVWIFLLYLIHDYNRKKKWEPCTPSPEKNKQQMARSHSTISYSSDKILEETDFPLIELQAVTNLRQKLKKVLVETKIEARLAEFKVKQAFDDDTEETVVKSKKSVDLNDDIAVPERKTASTKIAKPVKEGDNEVLSSLPDIRLLL